MDFEPSVWLSNDNRLNDFLQMIAPTAKLLKDSGSLNRVVKYWVRSEVISEQLKLVPVEERLSDEILLLEWCKNQWNYRLNEIFLEKKDLLDIVSFNMLIVSNHAISFELYHRLKHDEATFYDLSKKYSVNTERHKDPFRKNKRMGSLPPNLRNVLRTMQKGQLTTPIKLDNAFLLLRLENYESCKFSESTKEKLLLDQFSSWTSSVAQVVVDSLE